MAKQKAQWLAIGATLIAAMNTPTAQAQLQSPQGYYCTDANRQFADDVVIAACTELIQSKGRSVAEAESPEYGPSELAAAYNDRANAYAREGDYARAIADLTEAIRDNPRLAAAYFNRSMAYQGERDYPHAIADSDQAAQLDPQNPLYQDGRCWMRALANVELDVARAACDASLRLQPNAAHALNSRAMVGLRQRRWQEAWRDFDAAAISNPGLADYLFGRGIAAIRLGHVADGRADLAHASQLDPNLAQRYADYGINP
jgi:tetratricopeptide (TPR) repeat protein